MIFILLPAYNEEKDLGLLLDEFVNTPFTKPFSIIVVNDGSIDRTEEISNSYGSKLTITVLSHKVNLGLGKALATGFKYIGSRITPADMLITMDSDNSHKPVLVAQLEKEIGSGMDISIASRFLEGSRTVGVPFTRRLISHFASIFLKLIFPMPGVADYTCGYRAFSGRIVKELSARYGDGLITESGFAATLEILLKARQLNAKCSSVPFILRYDDKIGKSKMKLLKTVLAYTALICRIKL